MRTLNSFISKTALAFLLVASFTFAVDHNKVAQADEKDHFTIPGSLSGSFGFFTEYRYRGLDQSDEHPAIQGSFDWSHEMGFYAGVWGSNVDFGDGDQTSTEFDWYAGVARQYYGVDIDLGVLYYTYPGANDSLKEDFVEYKLGLGYDFELLSLSSSINYSPQFFAGSGNATYLTLDSDIPLAHGFGLSAHLGRQWLTNAVAYGVGGTDAGRDYLDWSIGLNYATNGFDVSVTYVDTDLSRADKAAGADDTVVVGVTRSF